jgi:hypothetical protein
MSAVITGPRAAATPPKLSLAPELGARLPELPRELPRDSDPVIDDPDTEELDLAALLVAGSRCSANSTPPTPPGGALARVAPVALAQRPHRAPERSRSLAAVDVAATSGRGPSGQLVLSGTFSELGRLGLHLLLAALPLLAISAQVFGLVNMNISAGLLVLPLTAVMVAVSLLRPLSSDRIVVAGMVWGLLATVVYDGFRLDTVYLMGWWGDFIPKMGTWLINTDPSNLAEGAVAGYLWRYLGDGGGIGVVFFVLAAATGLRSLGPRATIAAAVGFAVFPVWAGLIGTVALSPRGQSMMFPLTSTTIVLSLIGHLIFGAVMGLGAVRCEAIGIAWPWPPLLERLERRPGVGAAVPWASITATGPRATAPRSMTAAVPAARSDLRPPQPSSGPVPGSGRGPLLMPSTRPPRTGSLPVQAPGAPGRTDSGSLEVPSWPGASIRAVRGWPSSAQPAVARVGASGGGDRR